MKSFSLDELSSLALVTFLALGCGSGSSDGGGFTSQGVGTGSFALDDTEVSLAFDLSVDGLSGPITAAHFHNAAAGVDGPVVRTLTFGSSATGSWTRTDSEPLTAALVAELKAGRIYANIHTAARPGGEIRGQLAALAVGEAGFTARLSGDQEVPDVTTSATGTGSLVLNAARTELSFEITVENLSGPITAAHFHLGAAGASGGVVQAIAFTNRHASGIWSLSAADLSDLEAGNLYVNVHTGDNPSGEIRGQVLPNTGMTFTAKLIPVASAGGGGSIY